MIYIWEQWKAIHAGPCSWLLSRFMYCIVCYTKDSIYSNLLSVSITPSLDWVRRLSGCYTVHGCSLCESLRSFCLEQPAKLRRDSKGQWSTDGLFRNTYSLLNPWWYDQGVIPLAYLLLVLTSSQLPKSSSDGFCNGFLIVHVTL